jgi:O-antigen ligase
LTLFRKISRVLLIGSPIGLAVFAPFSISGSNISIMFGFLGAIIGMLSDDEIRARYRLIRHDPLAWAALALALLALPSVFISENVSRALSDWRGYWVFLVYLFIAYNFVSERLRRTVFWVLLVSSSLAALVALIQFSGGMNLLLFRISADDYRPGGTLYNMTFAGILYQLIAVNFAVSLSGRPPRQTIAIVVGGVLQLIALLLTMTRGAWLALLGAFVTVPLVLRRRAVIAASATVIVLAAVVALQDDTLRQRAFSIVKSTRTPTDTNVSTRLTLWDISWDVFLAHPILGTGMGDYTIEAEKLVGDRQIRTAVDSHNLYLQILATRGLLGFIPFVVFWVVLFRVLFRGRKILANRHPFGTHFVTGVIGAAVAVMIGALTENNLDDEEVFTAFMMLVGMARSFALWPDGENGDDSAQPT